MPNSGSFTVRPGDSLAKIASKLGTTVEALAQANGITDVNKIKVGQVLKLPASGATATPASAAPAAPSPAKPAKPAAGSGGHELGALSAKFETGNRGPGTVSTGAGDKGGVSYGSFQLASKLGRPEEFLKREGAPWTSEFGGAKSGTPAFTKVWKAIALKERDAFGEAQHAYIKRTHYDPLVAKVLAATGVDLNQRSDAVRDAAWSTAVQHGPGNDVIVNAMAGKTLDDRALLNAIYAERGRKDPDGKLARFRGNSAKVQAGVAQRFKDELRDALKMLDG